MSGIAERPSEPAPRGENRDPRPDASQAAERNRVLRALPAASYARLAPQLEEVRLPHGEILWEADVPIRFVYFPRSGVISALVILSDEQPVEAATIGREGVLGVPVALGVESTSLRVVAQIAGAAARLPVAAFRAALAEDRALRELVLAYAESFVEQTAQAVACNRRHSIDERCARWLLMTHDRVGTDSFALTHEFLAFMLGVRRATVTVAAGMLQAAGMIRYSRGKIAITDRARLEESSCECYRRVRDRSERIFAS